MKALRRHALPLAGDRQGRQRYEKGLDRATTLPDQQRFLGA
jgi:hypothetical protein